MMRYFFIFFVFPIFSFSQITNRFYPPVSNLLNSVNGSKKIPISFNFYHNWVINTTDNFYCKDLQMSPSSDNSTNFFKFDLIVKIKNKFEFGNSKIQFSFNDNKNDFSSPIPIRYEDLNKIESYIRKYDINNYNPKNLNQRFYLTNKILNLSEKQIVVGILNGLVKENHNNKIKNVYLPYTTFISEIKKKGNIDISHLDLPETRLDTIINAIYKFKKEPVSNVLYDVFIKDKQFKNEFLNLKKYLNGLNHYDFNNYLDDLMGYSSTIYIDDYNLSVSFPKEFIQIVKNTSDDNKNSFIKLDSLLKIRPSKISIKNHLTIEKKGIEITMEHFKENKSFDIDFILPNEIKLNDHLFLKHHQREFQIINSKNIKNISIFITEGNIEAKIIYTVDRKNNEESYTYDTNFIKQSFKLN